MSFLTSRAKRVGSFAKDAEVSSYPEIALLERFVIKHLMTSPTGNSEFCFPETPNVPRGEAEGNIGGLGETKLTVSKAPVIKCLLFNHVE